MDKKEQILNNIGISEKLLGKEIYSKIRLAMAEYFLDNTKDKELILKDILKDRQGKTGYYLDNNGVINCIGSLAYEINLDEVNNVVATEQRAKQLQAITLMMIVADYFNDEAEVYASNITRFHISYNFLNNTLNIRDFKYNSNGSIMFINYEDAEKAIIILGKDTIKLALTGHGDLTNY